MIQKFKANYNNDKMAKVLTAAVSKADLAELFENTYVLDIREYGPVNDEEFKRRFYLGGHLNAAGYLLYGKIICSYIDYIIRHNFEDFAQVGFIGTPYKYI